jgi:hypothetical protein
MTALFAYDQYCIRSDEARKLAEAAVEASMMSPQMQELDADIALLAALQTGDGDAHDHFTNNGGRRYALCSLLAKWCMMTCMQYDRDLVFDSTTQQYAQPSCKRYVLAVQQCESRACFSARTAITSAERTFPCALTVH